MKNHVDPAVSSGTSPTSVTALQSKDLYTLEEVAYRLSTTLFAIRTLSLPRLRKFSKGRRRSVIYKATDPIRSLPELLEEFARKIVELESRIAVLEKRDAVKQE